MNHFGCWNDSALFKWGLFAVVRMTYVMKIQQYFEIIKMSSDSTDFLLIRSVMQSNCCFNGWLFSFHMTILVCLASNPPVLVKLLPFCLTKGRNTYEGLSELHWIIRWVLRIFLISHSQHADHVSCQVQNQCLYSLFTMMLFVITKAVEILESWW